ncbi:MAG: hypothetical protein KDC54_19310, partial [Lewinella sp.]|nr:hypothetical protein [Lewinella sp.]
MKKLLLSLALILPLISLWAQTVPVRQSFDWSESPTQYLIGSQVYQQWSFTGAVFGDRAPSHPHWVYRFPLTGPARLTVNVRNLASAPLEKRAAAEDETLGPELRFFTSVVREPEGYFGKISVVPMLRNGDRYEKVTDLDLLIEVQPLASPRGGEPPLVSVLADGQLYKIAVTETGVHKLTYDFLRNDLGISNLGEIDPRTIKLYGNGGGPAPANAVSDYPSDPVENPITIVGEADGSFDSGDYLLFYGEGPSPMRYDPEADQFDQRTNIYDNANYYFIKISGGNGLRLTERNSLAVTNE